MSKDTISVNMNVYDIPIVVEQLEKLCQENKQLKETIDKAKEYIKENACYGIQEKCCLDDLNYNECDELLEILGDKENE